MDLKASHSSIGARRKSCRQLGPNHVFVVDAAHLINAVEQVLVGGLPLVALFSHPPRALLVLLIARNELRHLRISSKRNEGAVGTNLKYD